VYTVFIMTKKPRGLGRNPMEKVAYFLNEKLRFTVNQDKER